MFDQLEDAYLQVLALRDLLDAEQRANAHLRGIIIMLRQQVVYESLQVKRALQWRAQADGANDGED